MRLIERPDLYIYVTFMTNNARLPGGGGRGRGRGKVAAKAPYNRGIVTAYRESGMR
jgi:hypothetical protein